MRALLPRRRELHREWPANNPIGYQYLEIIVAFDALNRLATTLSDSSKSSNMNLLFSFTGRAFHRHHNIAFVGHHWVSMRGILARDADGDGRAIIVAGVLFVG